MLGLKRSRGCLSAIYSSYSGSGTAAGAARETTLSLPMCGALLLPKPWNRNSISAESRRKTQLLRTPNPTLALRRKHITVRTIQILTTRGIS